MGFHNRVKVGTSTYGAGTVTLGAAQLGFRTLAAAGVANGEFVSYVIEDGNAWEIGTGQFASGANTLTRTLIESSTGALLNLSGRAILYLTANAADLLAINSPLGTIDAPTGPTNGASLVQIKDLLLLGNAPRGSLYELNAGGQAVVTPGMIQIINIAGRPGFQSSVLEIAQYEDTGKPLVINLTKSRGTGIIGDAGMNKPSQDGDRIVTLAVNSGGYLDGFDHPELPRAGNTGGHAGYITWTQEYADTADPGPNAVNSMFHIVASSANAAFLGQGGLQGNCLAQLYGSGPNKAQHNARERYRALFEFGPGTGVGDNMQVLGFNSSALVDPAVNPTHIFDGGVEYYAGHFYITHASDGAGVIDRRKMVTSYQPSFTTITQPAGMTVTARLGVDCIEFTVLVGGADIVAGSGTTVARYNINPVLPAVPMVLGSSNFSDNTAPCPRFVYVGTTNKITVNMVEGVMKAGQTYVLTVFWRMP